MSSSPNQISGRILVTGAGGFMGRHLAEALLSSGCEVVALDLDLGTLQHLDATNQCHLLAGDIADPSTRITALEGIETVFHLAATHLGALHSADAFRSINVEATECLARESQQRGVRRFVHCSTVGVYGPLVNPPADEETRCVPDLPYEVTKLEGERRVLKLVHSVGLAAVVLRPVWVYGVGCNRTHRLFDSIGKGRFIVAGKGQALRHCIYVDDMVEAFLLAATTPDIEGETFIIGDDQPITVRSLVDEIAQLVGVRRPRTVPLPIFRAVALMAEIAGRLLRREPPISRRTVRFFTGNTAFRTDKARAVLHFKPRFGVARGLTATYRGMTQPSK